MPEMTGTDSLVGDILSGIRGFHDFPPGSVDLAMAVELARNLALSTGEEESGGYDGRLNRNVEKFLTDYLLGVHGKLWLDHAAVIISQTDLSGAAIISYVNGLTWQARVRGFSATDLYSIRQFSLEENTLEAFVEAIAVLQAARYDFNHERVQSLLNRIEPEILAPENIGEAFNLFVQIRRNGKEPADNNLMETIESVCGEGSFSKVRHLVLHAMYLAESEGYADLIIDVAQSLRKENTSDSIAYMREAEGHRLKGDYIRALEVLEEGLLKHDPADVMVHSDFVRERMLIRSEWRIVGLINTNLSQAKDQMDDILSQHKQHLADAIEDNDAETERKNREMLFRVMEIMALFVALIGLLAVVVGATALGELELWERFMVIASGSFFMMFFFIMIHIIAGPKRKKTGRQRHDPVQL